MSQAQDPEVGSLAEETAKLLGAVASWAREADLAEVFHHGASEDLAGESEHECVGDREAQHGCAGHDCAGDEGAGARARGRRGSPECRWCPVCRVTAAVSHVPPEVTVHLAAAFASLARAAEAVVSTTPPAPGSDPTSRTSPVEHIDLEDWDEPGAGV